MLGWYILNGRFFHHAEALASVQNTKEKKGHN